MNVEPLLFARLRPLVCAALVCAALVPQAQPADVLPLDRAHSHNDYEHDRPLLDALEKGFCSVEADIWLVDGELLVAHDRDKVQPGRTLQTLYLTPLRERAAGNGGRVFSGGPSVTLLIDIKSDAEATYARLRQVLAGYASILTSFGAGAIRTNAVTAIISGNRPIETMTAESSRLAALDGRVSDLDNLPPVHVMPLISDSWRNHFTWRGEGEMPAAELEKLRTLAGQVHQAGRRLRLWAAPDLPAAWQVQHEAQVDLINTDLLPDLAAWLKTKEEGN